MDIKIVLEEQEEGGYTVYVPSLQGCVSQGEDVKDALKNILMIFLILRVLRLFLMIILKEFIPCV